jgi:hypothetical protein
MASTGTVNCESNYAFDTSAGRRDVLASAAMKWKFCLLFLAIGSGCDSNARTTGSTGGNGGEVDMAGQQPVDMAYKQDASPFDPASACVTATEAATAEFRPVDIIWLVDNSSSMQPAIDAVTQGLNNFATLIAGKNLDYKIIMLSLRSKTNPVSMSGSDRWGVCIPQPLAGDANCGNGTRFFQSSIDIKSTQPLEQLLGTLGQTSGYAMGEERGGEPWKDQLRAEATKTIVVVSDDDSRLSANQFETFKGGTNPNNPTYTLPPGILDASWGGLFDDYIFDGIYGWGSQTNPTTTCKYSDGTSPPKPGEVYTELVKRTSGVRAKICDDASAWTSFLDTVAQAVGTSAQLTCELDIPTPAAPAMLDPGAINVLINDDLGSTFLYKVTDAASCTSSGGWYYDNDAAPTKVLLCPTSCEFARDRLNAQHAKIDVFFGCTTIVG